MIISTKNTLQSFTAKVEIVENERYPQYPHAFVEFGPERQVSVLMNVEHLRELQFLIDQALSEHDRKPLVPVIDSIPMFVPETSA